MDLHVWKSGEAGVNKRFSWLDGFIGMGEEHRASGDGSRWERRASDEKNHGGMFLGARKAHDRMWTD